MAAFTSPTNLHLSHAEFSRGRAQPGLYSAPRRPLSGPGASALLPFTSRSCRRKPRQRHPFNNGVRVHIPCMCMTTPFVVPKPEPERHQPKYAASASAATTDSPPATAAKDLVIPQRVLPSVSAPKRVVLVRHGESTWNAIGRIQGSSDLSVLTAKGESQAETSRQMLMADKFDICFTSPLQRSSRTAEIIWGARKEPVVPLWDLREIDLYSFQGLMKEEGKARFGANYAMWQKDAPNFEIDGHYPVRELWERASGCWDTILAADGASILVVAHNAVNQALVATATGLGPQYFRQLLQSNCGVSVLDFRPRGGGDEAPHVELNRLNQTPSPPLAPAGTSAGRKTRYRAILVCHGATDSTIHDRFPASEEEPLNMLGKIQARKTAELLLDVQVSSLLTSPLPRARTTAQAILEVQEGAHCLDTNCVPRYISELALPVLRDLAWGAWQGLPRREAAQQAGRWEDELQRRAAEGGEPLTDMWGRSGEAWGLLLSHMARQQEPWGPKDAGGGEAAAAAVAAAEAAQDSGNVVVVVGHELIFSALLCHCLGLSQSWIGSVHLTPGSISVIDFPDGPGGRGVVRCLNYTAHLGRWSVPVTRPSMADEDF